MNQNLCTCKKFETPNVKSDYCKPFKAVFLFFIQAKYDMDISSDSSCSDEDTATGAYWDNNVGLPLTDSVSDKNFDNFRLGAFFYYRYMIL